MKKKKLSGAHRNVVAVQVQIGRIIAEWAKNKQCELIGQRVQWQMLNKDEWRPFNLYLNTQIEMKYSSFNDKKFGTSSNIRLLDEKGDYFVADVDSKSLVYENSPLVRYKIRRSDVQANIKYPPTWTSTIGLELVTLNPNSQEYKQTYQYFVDNGLKPNSVKKKYENYMLFFYFIELSLKNNISKR